MHLLEILDAAGTTAGTYAIQDADRIDIMTDGWAAGMDTFRGLDARGCTTQQGRLVIAR